MLRRVFDEALEGTVEGRTVYADRLLAVVVFGSVALDQMRLAPVRAPNRPIQEG